MRFRVEHDALADAVAWVARGLPARPVVPILSGLRLEAGQGLGLSCFDYDLAASASLPADVAEPGAVLVPGRLLAEITRSLPGQPAEFSSDGEEVGLRCGSAEFSLVSLPLADYPALPEPPAMAGRADGGDLATAIAQVLPAVSRDDTLPILTAVCLDIHGATMTLAATDRYRMAVREVAWEPARRGLRAVALVPARTLADAARIMTPGVPVTVAFDTGASSLAGTGEARPGEVRAGEARDGEWGERDGGTTAGPGTPAATREGPAGPGGDRTGPRSSEGMISFASRGRRLTGRLMGGEFIRYQSRFPAGFGCRADVPAASFIEAVRRVSLVADRASPVRLTFGSGRVVIEAQAEGRARAAERVTASFHGSEPSISFNPHYLLDGLTAAAAGAGPGQHAQAASEVEGEDCPPAPSYLRLQFTSPAKPALITLAGPGGPGPGHEGEVAGEGWAQTEHGTAEHGTAEHGTAEQAWDDPAPQDAVASSGPEAGVMATSVTPAFRYLVVPLRFPTQG